MIHSVWDWNRLRYDYYRSSQPASIGGWRPLTGLGLPTPGATTRGVGIDIEDALPALPADTVLMGHGTRAIGQVAVRRSKPATAVAGLDGVLDESSNRLAIQAFLAGLGTGALTGKFGLIGVGALGIGVLLVGISAGEKNEEPS